MAWDFNSTSDEVAVDASNSAYHYPDSDWSQCMWVRHNDGTVASNLAFYSGRDTTRGDVCEWWSGTDEKLHIRISDGPAPADIVTASAVFDNTNWHHICLVRSSTTLTLYVDDVDEGTATCDFPVPPNAAQGFGAAGHWNALDCNVAEMGKWDRALSADEITALSKGFAPSHFPTDMVSYIPCIREFVDLVTGLTLTNSGATVAEHPPIIYPQSVIAPDTAVPSTAFAVVVNDSLVFGGTSNLNRINNVVVNDSLVFGGTSNLNRINNVVVNDSLVFGGTAGLAHPWAVVVNDSLVFDGTGAIGRKWDGVINDALVFDGTGSINRKWDGVINDALVFGGTGFINRKWDGVINDALVFDGTGSINRINHVVITDSLVFDGTGSLNRLNNVVISDALVFGGTSTLNRMNHVVINDALVFDGTGVVGRGVAMIINDSLVFGGSISAALARLWEGTSDNTEIDPSWSDSPDDTEVDPSWGDI